MVKQSLYELGPCNLCKIESTLDFFFFFFLFGSLPIFFGEHELVAIFFFFFFLFAKSTRDIKKCYSNYPEGGEKKTNIRGVTISIVVTQKIETRQASSNFFFFLSTLKSAKTPVL